MIVAYHKRTIVYAYKGILLTMIVWTGGKLVDFEKIIDRCTHSGSLNVQPAPSSNTNDHVLLGLAFDKRSPYSYIAIWITVIHSMIRLVVVNGVIVVIPQDTIATQQTVANYVH